MIAACNSIRACMWKAPTAYGPFNFVGAFLTDPPSNYTRLPCFECPDFWRVPSTDTYVLSTMKHGWAVGSYTPNTDNSQPDTFSPMHGLGIPQLNQSYDVGSAASSAHRSFFDAKHNRQVLWGSVGGAVCPGSKWSGLMSFPRVVQLDPEDSSRLVTFPLPEISLLWTNTSHGPFNMVIPAGTARQLPVSGAQLDLQLSFAANASVPRTFGVRVLTPRPSASGRSGGVNVTVSTVPGSAYGRLGGGAVRAPTPTQPSSRTDFKISGDAINLRILVDHVIVECFAEGGRVAATAWLCAPSPSEDVGVEIFNEGPEPLVVTESFVHTVASVNRLPWPH
jgi:sucrose-6-phosphate hydrolase SacC (GH32 family)